MPHQRTICPVSVDVYVWGLNTAEIEKIIARRWDDQNQCALYDAAGAFTREEKALARRLARDAADRWARR